MSGAIEGDFDGGGRFRSEEVEVEIGGCDKKVPWLEGVSGAEDEAMATAGAAFLMSDVGVDLGVGVVRGDRARPPVRVVERPMSTRVGAEKGANVSVGRAVSFDDRHGSGGGAA